MVMLMQALLVDHGSEVAEHSAIEVAGYLGALARYYERPSDLVTERHLRVASFPPAPGWRSPPPRLYRPAAR